MDHADHRITEVCHSSRPNEYRLNLALTLSDQVGLVPGKIEATTPRGFVVVGLDPSCSTQRNPRSTEAGATKDAKLNDPSRKLASRPKIARMTRNTSILCKPASPKDSM